MTCSRRVWHFDKEITLQGAKVVFILQKHPWFRVPRPQWALSHPPPPGFQAPCLGSNALTALPFVLAERFTCLGILVFDFFLGGGGWFGLVFGFSIKYIHTLSYTYLSHNQQDKYTRTSLTKSSSCLDFHPNVWLKTAGETSPASPTFYGLTNSPYPTAARS